MRRIVNSRFIVPKSGYKVLNFFQLWGSSTANPGVVTTGSVGVLQRRAGFFGEVGVIVGLDRGMMGVDGLRIGIDGLRRSGWDGCGLGAGWGGVGCLGAWGGEDGGFSGSGFIVGWLSGPSGSFGPIMGVYSFFNASKNVPCVSWGIGFTQMRAAMRCAEAIAC